MKHILLFFFICALVSCQQKETKKIYYFKNDDGSGVQEVRYYKNPKDSLTFRKEDFYTSGKKYYTGQIINGKKDGNWIWWYENGNKKDACQYVDGFYVDTVYHWYPNGNLKQIEVVAGKTVRTDGCCSCNGKIIRYYETGKPRSMFTSINDIEQDTAKSWYDSGQLEWIAIYKDGKEEGISETFYSNGQKEKSGRLVNGLLDGALTHWDSTGKIISITNYKQGKEL